MSDTVGKERQTNGAGNNVVSRLAQMQKRLLDSNSKFANHAAAVAKAAALYQEMKGTIRNAEEIEESLFKMSGIERQDGHAFVMVRVEDSAMCLFTSACGHLDAVLFSNPKIKSFLKENGVRAIIGIIYEPEDPDIYHRTDNCSAVPLNAVAMQMDARTGYKFERLVADCEGSFRHERGPRGWAVFESE